MVAMKVGNLVAVMVDSMVVGLVDQKAAMMVVK